MISVVIPTFNAEATLGPVLASLVPAVVHDVVREAIIVEACSPDEPCLIAEAAGTTLIRAPKGRGSQLSVGAAIAKSDWLLFLHDDTVLALGCVAAANTLIVWELSGE